MSNKKEIDTLIDLSRKVGQAFCNKDTYSMKKHLQTKYSKNGNTKTLHLE
jgi:hypothetical protein